MTAVSLDQAQWLDGHRPCAGVSLRLFCFASAGGCAHVFRAWPAILPGVDVCAVQLPGRGRRLHEPAFTDLITLAERSSEVLAPLCGQRFAMFGHSMGGLLAFEIARRLERDHGLVAQHLIVAGARPPHLITHDRVTWHLAEAEFLAHVRDIGETPDALLDDPEWRSLFLPALRGDFQAVQTYGYQAGPPLSCPITALGGMEDRSVPGAQLGAWSVHTTARFVRRMIPGGHFFVVHRRSECLQILAEMLGVACLAPGTAS